MKKLIISLLLTPQALLAQSPLEHKDTIQRNFPAPKTVGIDNISGSVHVTGYNGSEVQLTAVRTITSDTQELLDRGQREITLKSEVKDGELEIYPDGPFRESHSPFDRSYDGHPGYHFSFEITVKVPVAMNLDLRNVNHGGIHVENVEGHFAIHEVNGEVDMKDIAGQGDVRSVNGAVHLSFTRNPTGPCTFRTVNGPVEVDLKPGLSADLEYKTLHGGIYTDYEITGLPTTVSGTAQQSNGHFVYRSHGFSRSRVGAGGPLLSFETVNGEIRILQK